ncbi:HIT family protein [Guptibacillus hwajinpoensis]|uniref:Diadenosine tetraphosphate (Ap4A) HIT family hydrolase n=1 Tax=Guptibacillus hwajinpoensis TaxID=208199 RepID=A0ABU0K471_9BACL|nr:hypothetical protein [Alkalihalobacillus hemicentroti]MDQ0483084.1 diadenosine tetraphosphate (Ap4A) HIT family hydrolase [Alkalihalobacillus hemicentroti]
MTTNKVDWKQDRILAANSGDNPMVLAKMKSGFAVMGDTQFLPGYCVLLPSIEIYTLNDLNIKQRSEYLLDMSIIGDAISAVCDPKRINYSIYGNTDAYLHAHIFPRYEWEPAENLPKPVWQYPKEKWTSSRFLYSDVEHLSLKENLIEKLDELTKQLY